MSKQIKPSAKPSQTADPKASQEVGFINPYNFVRWAPQVHRGEPRTHEKFSGLSGRITVELTPVTALCIPDPEATTESTIEAGEHRGKKRLDKPFCRVDGKPYIPGSALKGMLRSVAEATSNSCFSILTSEVAVFRDNREFAVNYRRLGRLVKTGDDRWAMQDVHPDSGAPPRLPQNPVDIWKNRNSLYKSKGSDLFPDPERHKPMPTEVDEPFERNGKRFRWYDFLRGMFGDTERRDYDRNGSPFVIRKGGKIVKDRRPKEPERREGGPVVIRWPIDDHRKSPQYAVASGVVELYGKMIQSEPFRRFHNKPVHLEGWQEQYLDARENDLYWYRLGLNSDEVVQFGRNFRYKWAYEPRQALPRDLLPCRDPKEVCPCCGMFGMVEQRTEEKQREHAREVKALASMVAIGPARWSAEREPRQVEDFCKIDDHKILGTPKFSCRSFYLEPSAPDKFDVSTDEFVRKGSKGRPVPNQVRGRKFYWHHTALGVDWKNHAQVQEYLNRLALPGGGRPDETNQNAKIEVLLPGAARFSFDIDFENLSDWELGLLLWTLELPDVEQGAHHLGLGKPLGLGTVTLKIKRIELIDRNVRYTRLFETGVTPYETVNLADQPFCDYVNAFKKVMAEWNPGQTFDTLPNIQDLKVILSQRQPAHANREVMPISYPPGDPHAKRKPGDPHPRELHHLWFTVTKRWSEPLRTIQEIANGKFQSDPERM